MLHTKLLYIMLIATMLGLTAFTFRSWLEAHDDQLRLTSTIQTQEQLINVANSEEKQHAVELQQALAQIGALKKSIRSPQEILRTLPNYLPLPQPITMAPNQSSSNSIGKQQTERATAITSQRIGLPSPSAKEPGTVLPDSPAAEIPAADLKPLFDFVQDCRACQLKLAQGQVTLQEEQSKSRALARERDAALNTARGGNFWIRIRRNVKWLALGAIAGSIASHKW